MISFVLALFLAGLTLAAISLQKTYFHLPHKELKRRARSGDNEAAALLYRAVANGGSLDVLLWAVVGLSATGFFIVLSRSFPLIVAAFGCAALVWVGFAWLPNTRVTSTGISLARYVTPVVARLLDLIGPRLEWFLLYVRRHSPLRVHTGLYQKEDLIELIETQQVQADNRIAQEELRMAVHVLTFGDKIVRDVMVPRRVVSMIKASEAVGPILMDELHKSGHSRFPVYDESPEAVVGTLFLRDLVRKAKGGQVKDYMSGDVFYVHDEQSLYQALQAFLKTKHHLFVVVNRFEEFVGILTIEDIIEQILGKQIIDEFDKYDDMRAVAALQAAKQHKTHAHQEPAEAEATQHEQTVVESEES